MSRRQSLIIAAALCSVFPAAALAQVGSYTLEHGYAKVKLKSPKNNIIKANIVSISDDYSDPINEMLFRAAVLAKENGAPRIAVIDKLCVETMSLGGVVSDSRCSFSIELLIDSEKIASSPRGFVPCYFDVETILTGKRDLSVLRILNQ